MSGFLGELGFDDLPFVQLIDDRSSSAQVAAGAQAMVFVGAVVVLFLLTRYRLWRPLFDKWLTSVDHKKIGIMYAALAVVMMARGVLEGVVMRVHQAGALHTGMLSSEHYAELFSTHGTIMVFFVAVPMVFAFINYVLPLQIGARDMAFPLLNQISLALTAAGAALIMISLVVGQFGTGGWSAYPPYTEKAYSPGPGTDYWIWSVTIAGFGSLLSAINFIVTVFKMRAPGMTLMRMPLFVWTALCSSIMLVFVMPPITVSTVMLAADRYLDFHFFTNELGGNMMNYINIFWMFGHPEVYVLVLPAYGVFAEVVATFSAKRLYGYTSLVLATMCIAILSNAVWLHHFFTMGQTPTVNIAFGIATMMISIPTGVKLYDWMATMFRGRIRMRVPMIYLTGFFILFTIGGLTGIILANPTIDFQVHNSLFLVAHFHNALIPGVLFGLLAAIHYWFPKAFGFRLNERWGAATALLWIAGFTITFMPLYWVGLNGMARRSATFSNPDYVPWMMLSAFGAVMITAALLSWCWTLWISIRDRAELAVPLGDPWDGRTLEWSIPSPPPPYNFARIPHVSAIDAFAEAKAGNGGMDCDSPYLAIEMPAQSWLGMTTLVSTIVFGFAMVWQIWWLAAVGALAVIAMMLWLGWCEPEPVIVPAQEVEAEDRAWREACDAANGVVRSQEVTATNQGLAAPDIWRAA